MMPWNLDCVHADEKKGEHLHLLLSVPAACWPLSNQAKDFPHALGVRSKAVSPVLRGRV